MRTDLISLRLFLTVFNLGNLSRAAERENIAPSAVSKRLNELEQSCGTPLFYRHARGVTPTPAGEALSVHAKTVLAEINKMSTAMSAFASGEQGEVRIHAHSSAVVQYLPQDIAGFRASHPGVQIRLREETSPEVIISLGDSIADIGIIAGNVPVPAEFTSLPYQEDRLMAVLPAEHRFAKRPSIAFSDVAGDGVIGPERGSSLHFLLSEFSKSWEKNLQMTVEVRTLEAAIRMAGAGLGTAVVPSGMIVGQEREGIAGVPLSDTWAKRNLLLCIKGHEYLSASSRLMLAHLQTSVSTAKKPRVPKRK